MGRKANDGRGRLGGRVKGTRNKKTTTTLQEWLNKLLNTHRQEFEQALSNGGEQSQLVYTVLLMTEAINKNTETLARYAQLRESWAQSMENA